MSTIGPVMTVTDELLAELEDAAREAHIARSGNDWFSQDDCCWWTGNADEGDFISAASPKAITALTTELRRLRAENAELAQSLAESRANDQAAMGWLTSLRWASGDRGERMLPELVTHIEGLAKDYARLEWMLAEQCIMRVQNGTGSPLVYSLWWSTLGEGQINWHKSARDAIDAAMATQ